MMDADMRCKGDYAVHLEPRPLVCQAGCIMDLGGSKKTLPKYRMIAMQGRVGRMERFGLLVCLLVYMFVYTCKGLGLGCWVYDLPISGGSFNRVLDDSSVTMKNLHPVLRAFGKVIVQL